MYREKYQSIYDKYHNTKTAHTIYVTNQAITYFTFLSYPLLLGLLFLNHTHGLLAYIMIPGISFIAVSLFRHIINRPRPYESWQIPPLIPRDKTGHSFPSRHIFSIALIAALWCSIFLPVGILLLFAMVLLGIIRVFTGIHYLSDVFTGATLGLLCGWITSMV